MPTEVCIAVLQNSNAWGSRNVSAYSSRYMQNFYNPHYREISTAEAVKTYVHLIKDLLRDPS